ncbi:3-deoxy-manno-octulosonate cytidylyltransferase [Vibrio breoganii]
MNKIIGLLPVRLESSRLPGKALKDVEGLPAIIHAYKRANLAKRLDDVYICTDSDEIIEVAKEHGCNFIKTSHHRNGSERINEAVKDIDADIIINIQGDEVLVDPVHIDQVASEMIDNCPEYCMGVTPFNKFNSSQDFKAVLDLLGNLIYCSRSDIPSQSINGTELLKVVFIVGFTKASLKQFVEWPETSLERAEPNEFLRILEHGHKIKTVKMDHAHISLDTYSDLQEIRQLMKSDKLYKTYRK